MLPLLPHALRGCLTGLLLGLSTLFFTLMMVPPAVFKLVLPAGGARRLCDRWLNGLASAWVLINNAWIAAVRPVQWDVQGLEGLNPRGWYLVSSNHQSWVDILVLQRIFHGRIPFLKFFLKQELIWVPVIGLAWWALDFPFMKRYSKEFLQRHPELRGKDVEVTRRACEKFAELPVSVMNFVEGTRFTPAKHARQQSPYTHLLRPKAGGVAFVLETMGNMLQAVIDFTIIYPDGRPTLIDLLSGRVSHVHIKIQRREIPHELLGGSYENDPAVRERFKAWVNGLWAEKDQVIAAG